MDIRVGSSTRSMEVYAPNNLSENRPLMISMHGMNQDPEYQRNQAKWESVADTADILVVYPYGIDKSWDISGNRDIDFVLAIIDEMSSRYKIDLTRVYLSGFSMGGMFTYHAMNKIADKIAAFGPVSGYPMGGMTANASRPVPLIHVHGDTDDVVSYSGVQNIVNKWITFNNCSSSAQVLEPYPSNGGRDSKEIWTGGDCETEVILITLSGKGHWHSNDVVNTTAEIWNFVSQYTTGCGKNAGSSKVSIKLENEELLIAPATVTISLTADIEEAISNIEFFNGTTSIGNDNSEPYSIVWEDIPAGTHEVTAIATTASGEEIKSNKLTIKVNVPQSPYGGEPATIPGKIELENFDEGGNGLAYSDNTKGSETGVDFRSDEDVDIEECEDTGGGYNLGWAASGEWLEYTFSAEKAGIYALHIRAATDADKTLSIEIDDEVIDNSVDIANTGDWQNWETFTIEDVRIEKGTHIMKVTIGSEDFINLNYIEFEAIKLDEEEPPVKDTLAIHKGWNLIGCPLKGSTDIKEALSSIWENIEQVKNTDNFYDTSIAEDLNLLKTLEWGKGYFIKVDEDCVISW